MLTSLGVRLKYFYIYFQSFKIANYCLDIAWANFFDWRLLKLVLKFHRWAGSEADRWSFLLTKRNGMYKCKSLDAIYIENVGIAGKRHRF